MAVAPGFTHWVPLPYGAFGEILRDPLGFQLRARERFGDVIRFRNGPLLIHFLYHPDHVRRVLYERQKNYLRGWQYRLLRRLVGDNLVVTEGDSWLRRRRLAQPAFHRERLATYAHAMVDTTAHFLIRCRELSAAGEPFNVAPELSRLALAIAGRTLFSRDAGKDADAVGTAFGVVGRYLERRFNNPFTSLPLWAPTAANRRFKAAMRTLHEIVLAYIRQRRREGGDRGDLLSMLMQARDEETGEQMTDEELRIEVLTFLIAGHETTATALTWTCFNLARHPAVSRRVRQEIDAVLGDRTPTVADVPQLSTVRTVIEESMRLYPPVWALSRQAVADDEIAGFRIPAGSMIVLSPFVTHRHADFWPEPEVFDPDRFTAEQATQRHKGAYFPFLAGPHHCIGNEFAMLEMRLVIAMVLQNFDLEWPADQPPIHPSASLTLRPNRPVLIKLQPLDQQTPLPQQTGEIRP